MKAILFLSTFLLFQISIINAQNPQLISLDYENLLQIKSELKEGNTERKAAYTDLLKKADRVIKEKPYKVTDGDVPPTGDIHDFFTIGKYSWPNPDTSDGLPYIRRDGKTNPESKTDKYDMDRYNKTVYRVNLLSLAWFLSDDVKYANKASELLRVWFINPDTRMNPNFNCASALPGVYNGMPIGIIFGVQMINMLDYVNILGLSNTWSKTDNDALKKWFEDYTAWLLMSDYGVIESRGTNNHGTWFNAQVAAYAIFNNHTELAKEMIAKGKVQFEQQIAMGGNAKYPDGCLPRELDRNQSLNYSVYGLKAFCTLAQCAKLVNEDLWNYQTKDGKGLKLAFDFLAPYLNGAKEWSWPNSDDKNKISIGAIDIIRQASKALNTPELKQAEQYLTKIAPATSDKIYLMGINKK